MACPDAWYTLQPLIKVVFVSTIVAFCSTILGFATPVWISASVGIDLFSLDGQKFSTTIDHIGIWQACGGDIGCVSLVYDLPGMCYEFFIFYHRLLV